MVVLPWKKRNNILGCRAGTAWQNPWKNSTFGCKIPGKTALLGAKSPEKQHFWDERCWGWWTSPQRGRGAGRRAPSKRRTHPSRSRHQRERDWEYDPRTAFDEPGGVLVSPALADARCETCLQRRAMTARSLSDWRGPRDLIWTSCRACPPAIGPDLRRVRPAIQCRGRSAPERDCSAANTVGGPPSWSLKRLLCISSRTRCSREVGGRVAPLLGGRAGMRGANDKPQH